MSKQKIENIEIADFFESPDSFTDSVEQNTKNKHGAFLLEKWSLDGGPHPEDCFQDITHPYVFSFGGGTADTEAVLNNPESVLEAMLEEYAPGERTPLKGLGAALIAARIMLDNDIAIFEEDNYKDMRLRCETILHFTSSEKWLENIEDPEPWEWVLSYDTATRDMTWCFMWAETPLMATSSNYKHIPFVSLTEQASEGNLGEDDLVSIDEDNYHNFKVNVLNSAYYSL